MDASDCSSSDDECSVYFNPFSGTLKGTDALLALNYRRSGQSQIDVRLNSYSSSRGLDWEYNYVDEYFYIPHGYTNLGLNTLRLDFDDSSSTQRNFSGSDSLYISQWDSDIILFNRVPSDIPIEDTFYDIGGLYSSSYLVNKSVTFDSSGNDALFYVLTERASDVGIDVYVNGYRIKKVTHKGREFSTIRIPSNVLSGTNTLNVILSDPQTSFSSDPLILFSESHVREDSESTVLPSGAETLDSLYSTYADSSREIVINSEFTLSQGREAFLYLSAYRYLPVTIEVWVNGYLAGSAPSGDTYILIHNSILDTSNNLTLILKDLSGTYFSDDPISILPSTHLTSYIPESYPSDAMFLTDIAGMNNGIDQNGTSLAFYLSTSFNNTLRNNVGVLYLSAYRNGSTGVTANLNGVIVDRESISDSGYTQISLPRENMVLGTNNLSLYFFTDDTPPSLFTIDQLSIFPGTHISYTKLSADLAITSFEFFPKIPIENETISFEVVIENEGEVDLEDIYVTAEINPVSSPFQKTTIGSELIETLGPGFTQNIVFTHKMVQGSYEVSISISELPEESDHSNNHETRLFGVILPPPCNLRVSDVRLYPPLPVENMTAYLQATVYNDGSGFNDGMDHTARSYYVTIDSEDSSLSYYPESYYLTGLRVGEERNVTFSVVFGEGLTDFKVRVTTAQEESDSADNDFIAKVAPIPLDRQKHFKGYSFIALGMFLILLMLSFLYRTRGKEDMLVRSIDTISDTIGKIHLPQLPQLPKKK
jgi:hypothetical protein